MDYDIAVGVSKDKAKETALSETKQPTEPIPYDNSEEFAFWCKTLLNPVVNVDWKVAAALAAARMTGRVWAWVRAMDELRPGDHVAFNSGTVYYYQHAIVTGVQGMFFDAHLSPPQLSDINSPSREILKRILSSMSPTYTRFSGLARL